jgi:hypothetical protein
VGAGPWSLLHQGTTAWISTTLKLASGLLNGSDRKSAGPMCGKSPLALPKQKDKVLRNVTPRLEGLEELKFLHL